MAARVDAVHSRINSAMMMKQVAKQMGGVVKGLDKVMQSMDLEKISAVMEKFEAQFEDLDVHEKVKLCCSVKLIVLDEIVWQSHVQMKSKLLSMVFCITG
jgi:division protein CdvB (Snf7/Vps24/ESCRT-III family)